MQLLMFLTYVFAGCEQNDHARRFCAKCVPIRVFQLGQSSHFVSCLGFRTRQPQYLHPTQRFHLLPRRLVLLLRVCMCAVALTKNALTLRPQVRRAEVSGWGEGANVAHLAVPP